MPIHPTAIVDPSAALDPSVTVGPYAIIEDGVQIGAETQILHHAFVARGTVLGERCQIHPFAVVGYLPQDLKYTGAPSYTRIGDETIVREHATIHRGTMPESWTTVGRGCYLMATAHIGHNCTVGDHVILSQGAMLGGHVEIGQRVIFGGAASAHQFVRVGEYAMVGGTLRLLQDLPPFMRAAPEGMAGCNSVGLRRAGFSREARDELRACYRLLYRGGLSFPHALQRVREFVKTDEGRRLVAFLEAPSKRGIMRQRAGGRRAPQAAQGSGED